jgi:hypothetical protein
MQSSVIDSAIVSEAASPPRHFFFGFPATSWRF